MRLLLYPDKANIVHVFSEEIIERGLKMSDVTTIGENNEKVTDVNTKEEGTVSQTPMLIDANVLQAQVQAQAQAQATQETLVDDYAQLDIQTQSKRIFAHIMQVLDGKLLDDEIKDRTLARTRLLREYHGVNPFKNEYSVFFELCVKCPQINFTKEYLSLYLQQNRAQLSRSKNIDLNHYTLGASDSYNSFATSCLDVLNEVQSMVVTEQGFEDALATFRMLYLAERGITILETGAQIMSDGRTVNRRYYSGYEGMRDYVGTQFLELDNVVQQKKTRGAVCYGVTPEEDEKQNKAQPIGTLGIPGVDDYYTCYEGEMINLMGAAKAGKSRMCVQVLEHMLIDNGVNCLIWSLENGFDGWERMFRVKLFNRMYNKTVTSVTQKKYITENMLKSGQMPDDIRSLEQASWERFKNDATYGKLVNVEEPLCYDTFLEVLDECVRKYDVKFICIDYMGLMDRGRGAAGFETNALVADVYKKVLQYLKTHKIAGIFPTHLKQESTDHFSAMSNAELENADLRTAGGLSYEVVKTPDLNMALVANKADLARNYARLVHVPSRVAPFPLTELMLDLGSSTFAAVK